jgi:hypothetical protein
MELLSTFIAYTSCYRKKIKRQKKKLLASKILSSALKM